jgi:heme/copper-type cytochrome/quinol oxidase subunit 4
MTPISFTPEVIAGIVGFVLMLVFAYLPGLRVWYAGLKSEVKSYIMIGLLAVAAAVITLLSQYGIIPTTVPVTWLNCAKVILALLITNQPTYQIAPKPADVKEAKLARLV